MAMNSKTLLIKGLIREIPASEWEEIRDELLSMLLFSDVKEAEGTINAETGLSEHEITLIKKLAQNTEDLYKLYKSNQDNGSDQ
jgi:hypothetical protein